ncbi:type I restriction endonuclease subunit M [Vibrio coralliilyticus]|uniref:hypothetical protein n=1 Tax=Vibrio TaxID=662 RepID=UPI0005058AFD|nr:MULTISPECIES: hypothetical protein [Vibrio]KFI12074.1 type I restriction endonuclease subunit M [Vibrio sp. B183]NOI21173.1 type I restriction endonuclease subunit M [Vibrio coralliilyticus]
MNVSYVNSAPKEIKAQNYTCTAIPFEIGELMLTSGVYHHLKNNIGASLDIFIYRHKNGDWGEVSMEERTLNDEATRNGGRIMSVYTICSKKVWIITEADRTLTTVLFPIEY